MLRELIEEIQIPCHMTIYGQNLGGFKRENNECTHNEEKAKVHKIKIDESGEVFIKTRSPPASSPFIS